MIVGTPKEQRPTGLFPLQEGRGKEPLPSLVPLDGPVSAVGRIPRTHHTLDQLQRYRGPVTELQNPVYRLSYSYTGYCGIFIKF